MSPIGIGVYLKHLDHWLETFPSEQIHIVDGKNLVDQPWEELAKIESFLGLRPEISKKEEFYLNEAKGFYCFSKTRELWYQGCMSNMKGKKHPKIDEETRRTLQDFFAPFNEKLFKRIGRRLSWAEGAH